MSVIATVSVPASELPLGSFLDRCGDVRLTVETTVPTGDEPTPYLWVPADGPDSIVESLEAESTVATASVVDEVEDHVLVKISWADHVDGFFESIRERDAIVTDAVGTSRRWIFRLRFPAYEELSTFYTDCLDRGLAIELRQLHEAVRPNRDRQFGLTAAQREVLITAYEAGYFDVPRRTTLVELGDRLDISDSAVSQRLRRGLATLINATVAVDPQFEGPAGSATDTAIDRETGFEGRPDPDPDPDP